MRGVAVESPARTYGPRSPSSVAFGDTFSLREKGGGRRLVWCEAFPWVIDAINREKAIRSRPRRWKVN
jgi:hypothetical protein